MTLHWKYTEEFKVEAAHRRSDEAFRMGIYEIGSNGQAMTPHWKYTEELKVEAMRRSRWNLRNWFNLIFRISDLRFAIVHFRNFPSSISHSVRRVLPYSTIRQTSSVHQAA